MAFSLSEIRNADFYKNAPLATQQKIEAKYAEENPPSATDRLVGQAQNLAQDINNITSVNSDADNQDVVTQWANKNFGSKPINKPAYPFAPVDKTEPTKQIVHSANIQRDLPNEPTENIRTGVATQGGLVNGMSWDDIANSSFYKEADSDTKFKIRNNFVNQGGTAIEKNASIPRQAVNVLAGGVAGTTQMLGTMATGLTEMGANAGFNSSKTVLSSMGVDTTGIDEAQKATENYLQGSLDQFNNYVDKYSNALGVSTTTSGRVGNEIIPGLVEGGILTLSEGSAAPILFTGETARAYGSQEAGKKDITSAMLQGGIQTVANEVGGGFSRVRAPKFTSVENVASRPVQEILGSPNKIGAVESTARNMGAAYGGTYLTGLAQGKTPEEAQKEAIHATSVAGGLSLTTHAIPAVRSTMESFKSNPEITEPVRAKIETQAESFNKAGDSSSRRKAFDEAPEYFAHAAADDLASNGWNPLNMGGKATEGYSDVTGTRGVKTGKINPEQVRQNIKEAEAKVFDQHKEHVASNSKLMNDMLDNVEGDIVSTESKQIDGIRKKIFSSVDKWQKELVKDGKAFSPEMAKNHAEDISNLYEQWHELAPHDAEYFADNYTSPVTGKTGDINFQHDTNLSLARRDILNAGKDFASSSKPKPVNRLRAYTGHFIKHTLAHKLFGGWGNVALHTGEGIYHAFGNARRTVNQERQAANITQKLKENRPSAEVEPVIKSSGKFTESGARASARIEANLNNAIKSAKAEFKGHEDLQNQITPKTVNDEGLISSLRGELAKRKAEVKTQERNTQREEAEKAHQEANAKDVNEFKNVNPHLKEYFAEATRNLKDSGKEINLNNYRKAIDSIVEGRRKLASGEKATPFNAGSKEELYEDIRRGGATKEAKAEQQRTVEAAFKNPNNLKKDGTLTFKAHAKLNDTLSAKGKVGAEDESIISDYWNKKNQRVSKRDELDAIANQQSVFDSTVEKAFEGSTLSERKKIKFIKERSQDLKSKGAMSKQDLDTFIEQVKADAEALKQGEPVKKPTSPKPKSNKPEPESNKPPLSDIPEGENAIWRNKDNDLPVKVIKHQEDGWTQVRPAIIDPKTGAITGYSEVRYLETKELVKAKPDTSGKGTSEGEGKGTTEGEGSKLSEDEIKDTRKKYTSELSDVLGTDKFDSRLDELEAFLEDNTLADMQTDKAFHRYVEVLTRIDERMKKGISNPKALVSQEDISFIKAVGNMPFAKDIRLKVLGDADAKPLPEAQRKTLAENDTPERRAQNQKAEALKRTQEQNRAKREASQKRMKAKNLKVSR